MKMSDLFEFALDEGLMDSAGRVIDDNGNPPQYLYAVVDTMSWSEARMNGALRAAGFSPQIVASADPERKPGMSGNVLLRIKYDPSDDWITRQRQGEVLAYTRSPISTHKITMMGRV